MSPRRRSRARLRAGEAWPRVQSTTPFAEPMTMLAIHILAGIIAILAGFTALYAAKGDWLHRKAGTIFSWAMLLMTALGAGLALSSNPNRPTVVAGLLSFYLVATGLLTVIRSVEQQRRLLLGLACMATAVAVAAWLFAFMA